MCADDHPPPSNRSNAAKNKNNNPCICCKTAKAKVWTSNSCLWDRRLWILIPALQYSREDGMLACEWCANPRIKCLLANDANMLRVPGPSMELGTHTDTYKKGTPRNFWVQCTQRVYKDTNFNECTPPAQITNLNESTHANPDVYLLMQSAEDFDDEYIFLSNYLTTNESFEAGSQNAMRP